MTRALILGLVVGFANIACARPLPPPVRNVMEPAPVVVGPLQRGMRIRVFPAQ